MSRRSLTSAVGSALGLAALAAAVFFLLPVQLGGWTAYAVIHGTSMEPRLHTGDLVITRSQGHYAVGDVVLYHSALLDSSVYHRIVSIEDGRYSFRGDNRTENDPEKLGQSSIRGTEWVTIPSVGSALVWVAEPIHLAILVFLLVFSMLFGGREISRRRRPGDPVPVHPELEPRGSSTALTAAARALTVAAAVGLLLFGALSALAFTRQDTTSQTVVGGYAHVGTFTYQAAAKPGVVYPDSVVRTGQPIFAALSNKARVTFAYRFDSREHANVRGAVSLDLRVEDPQTRWTRVLPLAGTAPFTGSLATVAGVIDLHAIAKLVRTYGVATGTNATAASVTVIPHVEVSGTSGDTVIDETFAPELPFTLDAVALKLADQTTPLSEDGKSLPAASPLLPRSEGSGTVEKPAVIAFGPVELGVLQARSIGLVGIGISLVALLLGGAVLLKRLHGSERDRIEARFGARIVSARAIVPDGRWISDLDSIDELIRVADAYDRVVLRIDENGGDTYLVDDGIAVYRFRPALAGALGAPRAFPAHGR